MHLLAVLLTGELALASGYHPDFDQAVEEASWIVLGEVIASLPPASVVSGFEAKEREGQLYRVKVTRSFGADAPGAHELYVWDAHAGSTAGYHLSEESPNLSFLVAEPRLVATDGLPVAKVFRNLSGIDGKGRGQGRDAWVTLLEWTNVGERPLSLAQARQALADSAAPRELLNYVLEHWPGALADADADDVVALIERRADDAYVTSPATRLLRSSGRPLTGEALRRALLTSSPHARSELVHDVDATNIGAVRDVLWSWIADDADGALHGLEPLAAHDPAWLRAQLAAHALPFWLDIPAIRALELQPRDVGRDYAVTTDNPWQLVDLGNLVKGDDFGVRFAMTRRDEAHRALLPLLVPHLAAMAEADREVAVAALRTAGFTVHRDGSTTRLGPREGVPLRLELEPLGGDRVRLVVRATRPTLVCDRVQVGLAVAGPEQSVSQSAMHGTFGPAPRDCFTVHDDVVLTQERSIAGLVSDVVGPATVSGEVLFIHPGTEHGLDGWTGLLAADAVPLH